MLPPPLSHSPQDQRENLGYAKQKASDVAGDVQGAALVRARAAHPSLWAGRSSHCILLLILTLEPSPFPPPPPLQDAAEAARQRAGEAVERAKAAASELGGSAEGAAEGAKGAVEEAKVVSALWRAGQHKKPLRDCTPRALRRSTIVVLERPLKPLLPCLLPALPSAQRPQGRAAEVGGQAVRDVAGLGEGAAKQAEVR